MMVRKILIGKKAGMTRVYDDDGNAVPVTAIESPDCVVVQKRSVNDMTSLQLGFDETNNVNKPMAGHFESNGVSPRKELHEFQIDESSPMQELTAGDDISPGLFDEGEMVDVTGRTKGRGFSGVMRRWNFSGGPASHGGRFGRRTGSVGQAADPSRIFPGKKMPGQYGSDIQTVENLKVMNIFPDESSLLVSGSIPGADGWTVILHDAVKQREGVENG